MLFNTSAALCEVAFKSSKVTVIVLDFCLGRFGGAE